MKTTLAKVEEEYPFAQKGQQTEETDPYDVVWLTIKIQLPFAIFQLVTTFYLIFVSFFQAPRYEWRYRWLTIIPWFHFAFALIDFLIIPLIVIIQTAVQHKAITKSLYSGPIWLCTFISFLLLF